MKHRRIVVARHGRPEVLEVREEETPEPSAGELRVRIEAAGVSAYDLMFRRSRLLPGTPKVPFTPGEDVVGIVDRLGDGVTGFEVGERVAAGTFSMGVGGGYTEVLCMDAREWVRVPAGIDPAEAVALVVNYCTAHTMLHRAARMQARDRILIQGAAGGVGTALLDLGRLAGLEVFGTASAYNHDLVRSLGGTPIDYKSENVVKRVRELTGDGVDVVFDPIGGSRQLRRSYRCLRKGGRLVWFGVAATKAHGMRVIAGSLWMQLLLRLLPDTRSAPTAPNTGAYVRDTLPELLALLAVGRLKPPIAARIPLSEAARAHELMERGRYGGKIVLVTGAEAERSPVKAIVQQRHGEPGHVLRLRDVDRTFPIEEVVQALDHLRAGHARGRIVVRVR